MHGKEGEEKGQPKEASLWAEERLAGASLTFGLLTVERKGSDN